MSQEYTESEKYQAYYTEAQHEREMTRLETANKRWFISFLIVLFMLFGTNIGWVIYESQFQDVVVENKVDGGESGTAFAIGTGIGDLYYGESNTDNPNPGEAER